MMKYFINKNHFCFKVFNLHLLLLFYIEDYSLELDFLLVLLTLFEFFFIFTYLMISYLLALFTGLLWKELGWEYGWGGMTLSATYRCPSLTVFMQEMGSFI